ncbi:hypothetical protein PPHE_a3248 [Pseudoalteromonas phenolica O-BC30]|nr:hypothetical protein [Pseudoalteromonas phenolica O-BC30]
MNPVYWLSLHLMISIIVAKQLLDQIYIHHLERSNPLLS